jgi:hypothetical protein
LKDIEHLKVSEGSDIQVRGSGELIHLLLENGLVVVEQRITAVASFGRRYDSIRNQKSTGTEKM